MNCATVCRENQSQLFLMDSNVPRFGLLALVAFALAVPSLAHTAEVAVIIDGPSDLFARNVELLRNEYVELSGGAKLSFPEQATFVGDYSVATAKKLLDRALNDSRFSVVVGFGFYVGVAVAETEALSKPVFLPVAAPDIQGLPRDGERSGRKNLSYLTGLFDLERDLRRFRDVIRIEKTGFVVDSIFVPDEKQVAQTLVALSGSEEPPTLIMVGDTPQSIVEAIPADVKAVYLGPLPRLKGTDIPVLIEALNERKIPSYASEGRAWVDLGAFTTLVPADEEQRRLRKVALNILETQDGSKPADMSTVFEQRAQLAINMKTARRIQFYPRFELMTEAELVDDDVEDRGERISLRSAVQDALDANLDLSAVRRDIAIAEADFRSSWGEYLPSASLSANADWIDPDVASSFFDAERQISYSPSLEQLIYSPRVVNNIASQNANRRRAVASVDSERLDTVSDTATAYLDVLRARTQEKISRDNLRLTRANLALAEIRVDIGTSGPEEVFRWQTEIANSRSDVIFASASRNQAEIVLNRFRNQPLEAKITTAEPLEPDEGLILSDDVRGFVDNPWSFKVFRTFMAEEAKRNAPELVELNATIESTEATLDGQVQELFLPTLAASAGVSHVPIRGGVGSEDLPGVAGIPGRVDWQWQAGISLSFDLDYPQFADIQSSRASVRQLEYQRDSIGQRVEERVRSALHQVSASLANVSLSEDAARASDQNLKLVQVKYRQGTVDVITLIDAQSEALSAKLNAANAVYDFLADFVEVERATGVFQFLSSEEEQKAFIDRLQSFAMTKRDSE